MNASKLLHVSEQAGRRWGLRFRSNPSTWVVHTQTPEPFQKKKLEKEVIVNTKYDKCSDPMYASLLYSTEVDVFLTAKRGKVWMQRVYARKLAAERERKDREIAAMNESVPLALQYIYGGSTVVQGEKDHTNEEVYEADIYPADREPHPSLDTGPVELVEPSPTVFPYDIHQDIHAAHSVHNPDEGGGGRRRGRLRRGRRNAAEIHAEESSQDFEHIKDDLKNPEIRQQFNDDHLFKFGTANPDVAPTGIPCGGCGAALHCRAENIPGYIPSELLDRKTTTQLKRTLCQRCYIIKEYNVALKVSVSPEDYPKTLEHIKDAAALVVLVVDLLDFPGSVWPGVLDLLGKNKKIILVGNKIDLLVPDHPRYIKNVTEVLREEFLKKCFQNKDGNVFPKVLSAMCMSAKTGFNVEKLIDMIFNYWRWNNNSLPGDIYIVGCTNVGKSSLFNSLLESDLCKIRAVDLVDKAITSPVPGTTLNLLKFPVTRPEPHFISDRKVRIKEATVAYKALEQERQENLRKFKSIAFATPSNYSLAHTLQHSLKERRPSSGYLPDTDLDHEPQLPEALDPTSKFFSYGKWCFDSPGTVSTDQIINLLTAEEISKTLSSSPLRPRTMLLRVGHSVVLGGLGRLDYVEGEEMPPVRITVFCSDQLPINILETGGVEEFLANSSLSPLIGVPQGDAGRLSEFPELRGREVEMTGKDERLGTADIVLSSAGWVMVSPRRDKRAVFIAYTPDGRGITVRSPFLPYSVNQRGRRIPGSPAYRNNKFCLHDIIH